MKIDSLEALEGIVKLCRKLNVESIEIDGVKLALGSAPAPRKRKGKADDSEIESNELSDEQVQFWSVDNG